MDSAPRSPCKVAEDVVFLAPLASTFAVDFVCVWHGLVPSRQMEAKKRWPRLSWTCLAVHCPSQGTQGSLSSANSALQGEWRLHQDASDLFNHGGMIHTNVEAVHEQFRGDAVEMRARIGNDPVGAVGLGRVTKVRDDRMGADRRINAQLAESQEERVPRGSSPALVARSPRNPGANMSGSLCDKSTSWAWRNRLAPAEPCTKLSKTAAGKWAAAMGGRDEDDPAHLWHGLVEECLSQGPAFLGRFDDLVDWTRTDSLPEPRSAALDHHLRQDAAKAVAHDDHSVEGRVRTIGIKDSTRPPQGLPQQVGRVGDRVPARVANGPELKPCPECRVGLEVLDHPVPVPRAAPETMDKDDRDLAPLIGPARRAGLGHAPAAHRAAAARWSDQS